MRQLVFVLSKIYLYSTFYINIQQYAFSFSLNPNYFHSTKIFVQLQPKIISFDKNNFSTSTKNHFIQQQSSRAFKILSFNKISRASPVKYKTALSHASSISKTCQMHNWQRNKLCISQIEASTSPPPSGIPRAFDVFSCPGGGNLINLIFPGAGI